jgi:SAM-dependent methyltransferase
VCDTSSFGNSNIKAMAANCKMWDDLVGIHVDSDFYDMPAFLAGKCTLDPLEVAEIGLVKNKSLLHLQCHFGQDTISWARRGARVTGVDFSSAAINCARQVAKQCQQDARFIEANVYDLDQHLDESFDIVFSSAGVLCWLPDIIRWARTVHKYLKPGGIFYLREFHPFCGVFEDEGAKNDNNPSLRYPYFPQKEALRFKDEGSYADPQAEISRESFEWPHSMAEIISALCATGLRIEFLHEFPYTTYQSHRFLSKDKNGRWHWPGFESKLPLMFSLKASKTDTAY